MPLPPTTAIAGEFRFTQQVGGMKFLSPDEPRSGSEAAMAKNPKHRADPPRPARRAETARHAPPDNPHPDREREDSRAEQARATPSPDRSQAHRAGGQPPGLSPQGGPDDTTPR